MITHDNFLTVAEAARRLRVHEITVRRHIKAGRLKALRVGRGIRVPEEALREFLHAAVPDKRLPAYHQPPTPEELARRRRIIQQMLATRAKMKPLGMSTAELIREGRDELEQRYDRRHKLGD